MTDTLDYAAMRHEAITVARAVMNDHRSSDVARIEAARLILDYCHGYDPPPVRVLDLRSGAGQSGDERAH